MKVKQFYKQDLIQSKQFSTIEKDFLNAILVENQKYSVDETRELLSKKMKEVIR